MEGCVYAGICGDACRVYLKSLEEDDFICSVKSLLDFRLQGPDEFERKLRSISVDEVWRDYERRPSQEQ